MDLPDLSEGDEDESGPGQEEDEEDVDVAEEEEDEGDEAAADNVVVKDNKRLKGEISKHRCALRLLPRGVVLSISVESVS